MHPTPAAAAVTGEHDDNELAACVVVVDFWANGFGMRARIALHVLQVGFGFVEEDLRIRERSDLVLRMNPVHRSVPILIHRGRPIYGSINILQYIDEVWAKRVGTRLLPPDPLKRASARFWADFVDHEVFSTQTRFLKSKGEEKEMAKAELLDQLRRLEGVLGDRSFFSGDEFGFLDIVLIPFSSMFHGYKWVKRCKERESMRQVLPDEGEMYELHKKWYGIE
uniref:Glutathione S-transferase n=1 Tax=Oryza glaberrima TaxID=4538 RepID=I1Q846_ORYGL